MQRNAPPRSVFQLTRNVAILSGNHGKNAVPRNATWRQYTLIFVSKKQNNSIQWLIGKDKRIIGAVWRCVAQRFSLDFRSKWLRCGLAEKRCVALRCVALRCIGHLFLKKS